MRKVRSLVAVSGALLFLSGCAINVPSIGDIDQNRAEAQISEIALVNHIKCEVHTAIWRIKEEAALNQGPWAGNSIDWLDEWGAKVSLQVQVNVKSTATPGLSVIDPLQNVIKVFPENGNVTVSRNNSAGVGATLGSDITRTETMGYFYSFENLLKVEPARDPVTLRVITDTSKCGKIDLVADNDLQFYDFLQRKILLAANPNALEQRTGSAPYDVISFQTKFIVTRGFSVNPSLKLARVSINPSGTFYNGQRVRTNDLTITLGPVKKDNGKTTPTNSLNEQHLANLIGRAVADSIRDQQ